MNILPEELKEEKEYLQKTLEVINELINDADTSIQKKIDSINEIKNISGKIMEY